MASQLRPSLYCPFPDRISPHAEHIQAGINKSAYEFQLADDAHLARFCAGQFGWLTARAYPEAALDRLQIVGRCMVWTFANDDQHDDWDVDQLEALHKRFIAVLRGDEPIEGDSQQCWVLATLRDELTAIAPEGWMERFVQSVDGYLAGTRWEAPYRAANLYPDLETYQHMRQYTVAMYLFTDLIEIALGIALPERILQDPVINRLTYLTNVIVGWCNDLYSYEKELGNEVMNLVFVLQQGRGLSLEAAVLEAAAIHDADVREFVALKEQVPSFGPEYDGPVASYVANLESWMRGHISWYEIDSQRYKVRHEALELG